MRRPLILARCTLLAIALVAPLALRSAADEQPLPTPLRVARIKDLTSVQGIRDNMLLGYGLVVGLNGTGDKQQTFFSVQTLGNMLQRMGVNVQANIATIQVRNIAAVFVTATLPPFARPGLNLAFTVSSIGNATD